MEREGWRSSHSLLMTLRGYIKTRAIAELHIEHGSFSSSISYMKFTLTMALLFLAIFNVGTLWAGSIQATTCNSSDVQAAINSASDGDTVLIPPGTCTWTTQVSIKPAKAITVQGAGIGVTTILDNVPKGAGLPTSTLWSVETVLGKTFRLTGMTIQGFVTPDTYNKGTVALGGTSQAVRVDHIKFSKPSSSAIRFYGHVYGVVDHCDFDLSNQQQGILLWHDSWNGGHYGDGSFTDSLYLGTNKAIYIEDNTFLGTGIAGAGTSDSLSGGRYVFRYNRVTNQNSANHGTETSGRHRGVRSYEIYNNTYSTSKAIFTAIYLRGGTGVVFNNTVKGYDSAVRLANYRSEKPYSPWGQCDGSSSYDGNSLANGYPCLDQIGRSTTKIMFIGDPASPSAWPNQSLDPVYIWGNNYTPTQSIHAVEVAIQDPDWIAPGRDFIVGSVRPGYTPFAYPHPLVSGSTTTGIALPPPPRGLSVK